MGRLNPALEPGEVYERFVNVAYLLNLEERPLAIDLAALSVPILVEEVEDTRAVLMESYQRRYLPWNSEGRYLEGIRLRLPVSPRKLVNFELLFDVLSGKAVQLEGIDPVTGKVKASEVRINHSFFPIYEFGNDNEGVTDNLVYYLTQLILRDELRNRRTLYLVDDVALNETRRDLQKNRLEAWAALESLLFQYLPRGVNIEVNRVNAEDFLARAREIYQRRKRLTGKKDRGMRV